MTSKTFEFPVRNLRNVNDSQPLKNNLQCHWFFSLLLFLLIFLTMKKTTLKMSRQAYNSFNRRSVAH